MKCGLISLIMGFFHWNLTFSVFDDGEGGGWGSGVDFGDYTPSERVKEFADVGALAKGYDQAFEKIQSKGIIVPGESATDEEKGEFNRTLREHLGTLPPETPDGYSWKPPEGMEDHFKDMGDQFKAYHEAGYDDATVSYFMQQQADGLGAALGMLQDQQAEIAKASEAELREEWGDDYDENLKAAGAMEQRLPGMFKALKAAGIVNQADVMRGMLEMSRSTREDMPPKHSAEQLKGLQDELATLKKDPSYMRGNHPKHAETMARVREIQASLHKKT